MNMKPDLRELSISLLEEEGNTTLFTLTFPAEVRVIKNASCSSLQKK
jgi:hypothetical protein